MSTSRASRRCLFVLALTAGLVLAPLAPAVARPYLSRPEVTAGHRQPEPQGLLRRLWRLLLSAWSKDGAHLDPYG